MAEISNPGMQAAAFPMGDVALQYSAIVALGAGNRQLNVALAGVKAGQVLAAVPIGAIPDGYDIGSAFCTVDGTVTVVVNHPPLVLLAQFNIPVRIFRIVT